MDKNDYKLSSQQNVTSSLPKKSLIFALIIFSILFFLLFLSYLIFSKFRNSKKINANPGEIEICGDRICSENETSSCPEDCQDTTKKNKIVLSFKDPQVTIELVSENSSESKSSLYSLEIVQVNYGNEKEFLDNIYADYKDGTWSDYIFQIPNGAYYILSPGGYEKISIITQDELDKKLNSQEIVNKDYSTIVNCNTKPYVISDTEFQALECTFETQAIGLEYSTTDHTTNCMYQLNLDYWLIYEIPSKPAGSDVDACEILKKSGLTEIEVNFSKR